jgi:glycosyltransferase involved in cell wall biosynthesis
MADDHALDRHGQHAFNPPFILMPDLSISIVTPSFNQGAYIGEALASVRNQSQQCLEHLVMDGGSGDDTTAILLHYSEEERWGHLQWVSEPDAGQSHALNKGFAKAQGDIVGWLNSDDRYRPGCFERVIEVFRRHPDVDIVYGDYTCIDEAGTVSQIRREIAFSKFILLYHKVLYVPSTATFFRRRIFDEGNRLDEHLHYALDFDFFVRLAASGYRFQHIPAVLADFRYQPSSKSCSSSHKQLAEVDAIMRLHSPFLRRLPTPALRSVAVVLLRSSAGLLRYSEKLMRGYYFDRYRLNAVQS